MEPQEPASVLRIGELSRRVGVSDHVLRAWETRYGLLKPARSAGGFRLYSAADESRIRRMQAHLTRGLSAAQAAEAALAEEPTAGATRSAGALARGLDSAEYVAALGRALEEYDESAAQATLDRLLTDFTVEAVLRDVLMPYLRELGQRWEAGTISVAQEHFASNLIRGRLAGLARGWGNALGPHALLACPPGELHDLALMSFGIALSRLGWRVSYLGVNTPCEDMVGAVSDVRPDLIVLAATQPERFTAVRAQLAGLADMAPLAIAGAGATQAVAQDIGARLIEGEPVTAAEALADRDATPPTRR